MNVRSVRRWAPHLIVLLILAAVSFVVANVIADRSPVEAQAPTSGDVLAPEGFGNCVIAELAQLDNRIHVKCQPNVGGIGPTIVYFAAPTTSPADTRQANRLMSLLMTAWAFGRQPEVTWDDSTAANPPGCLAIDCRRLTGVKLR